jgi:hypothetical protein
MQHHLFTVSLPDRGTHLHAYLMSPHKVDVETAANRVMDQAEKLSQSPMASMILVTPLTTGTNLVRRILRQLAPEFKQGLKDAKDFHFSMFEIVDGDKRDKQLMDLH